VGQTGQTRSLEASWRAERRYLDGCSGRHFYEYCDRRACRYCAAFDTITARIPQFVLTFASVNFSLAIFNLIPLYPLDGYQILYTLLPNRQAVSFARSATYGPFIILLIIFLLPFLGQLSNLGNFPLFRISYYILLGSLKLVSLISGIDVLSLQFLYAF
jgi:Zn-dependent protease